MLASIPYLQDFLAQVQRSSADDYVDRINYFWTTMILIFFTMVSGAKLLFGDPIECMMPAEYSNNWVSYAKQYCYVSSTYYKHPESLGEGESKADVVVLGYYQWVPFILVLQAIFIYLPHLFWSYFQKSQVIDMNYVVEQVKGMRYQIGEEREKKLKEVIEYLKPRIGFKSARRGISYAGFGCKSSLWYLFTKAVTIVVIFGQLWFMNQCFGRGRNALWGYTMLTESLTNFSWQEGQDTGIFPRVTFCDFRQIAMGGLNPVRNVQCVLMANLLNEKIFVFAWCWFACTLILSVLNFFYTVAILFVSGYRHSLVTNLLKRDTSSSNMNTSTASFTSCFEESRISHFADETLGADGIQLLKFMERHSGILATSEFSSALYNVYYNDEQQRQPSVLNENVMLGEKPGKSYA